MAGDVTKAKILIGSHYDSVVSTMGADDNGSAIAVMLLAAKMLGHERDDICYVSFNGEEDGLLGSMDLAKEHLPNLKMVHILEMVGYTASIQKNPIPGIELPLYGDFIGVMGNPGTEAVLDKLMNCADDVSTPVCSLGLDKTIMQSLHYFPHLMRSDHAPFWDHNVPALMWTDTAEFRNPNYHKMTDTPSTLNYNFMLDVTKLLVKVCK